MFVRQEPVRTTAGRDWSRTGAILILPDGFMAFLPPMTGRPVLAFLALYWRRLPLLRRGYEPGAGLTAPIQRFQSGVVNDYVTWIVLGLAAIGGALALVSR